MGVAVLVGVCDAVWAGAGSNVAVEVGVGVAVGVAVGASERITNGRKMTVVGEMTVVWADARENKPDARIITNATLKISNRLIGTKKRCMNRSLHTFNSVPLRRRANRSAEPTAKPAVRLNLHKGIEAKVRVNTSRLRAVVATPVSRN